MDPTHVSTFRLYLLRAMYLLIAVGMGSIIWPRILSGEPMELHRSVSASLLAALTVMAALGVRYPLQMLPLLLFELLWKVLWVLLVGLPLWRAGQLDAAFASTLFDTMVGVVLVPIVLPWGYVWANYVKKRGEPWKQAAAQAAWGTGA